MQEPDAEVDIIDGEQGNASGLVEFRAGNEESKKNLRDQLRRTLSKKESFAGVLFSRYLLELESGLTVRAIDMSPFRRRHHDKVASMQEVAHTPGQSYPLLILPCAQCAIL